MSLASVVLSLSLVGVSASPNGYPTLTVPEALGVNIHFTRPRAGEMDMLAAGGFRVVRMDLSWAGTEREKGKYDFSAFDHLMESLKPHGIRALFILDYSNRLYDGGLSPHSPEGRQAFARWAAAAVEHFRGQGILWEMYNEPNIGFWKPKPEPEKFVLLALETAKAIRAVAPEELHFGPATSQIDLPFLEKCFESGLLEYWSAVSVHPYRQKGPETAADEYRRLRMLIAKYAPRGKTIPILSGEWGYSAAWNHFDEQSQGKMLPRQWLVNLSNDVPLSIWYDWHDDGTDAKEPEHHFGTVQHKYFADRKPVYDPKPAYLAAQALTKSLDGFAFNKRLTLASDNDYLLLFTRGSDSRLAAWTTAEPHAAVLPASPGAFGVTDYLGKPLPDATADAQGLRLNLTDTPQYLVPRAANKLLAVAAAWQRAPLDVIQPATPKASLALALRNPLAEPITVVRGGRPTVIQPGATLQAATAFNITRNNEPQPVRFTLQLQGLPALAQQTVAIATNPLQLELGPPANNQIGVRVGNPSGEALNATLQLVDCTGVQPTTGKAALTLAAGETEKIALFDLKPGVVPEYRAGVELVGSQGDVLMKLASARFLQVDDFAKYAGQQPMTAYKLSHDGDQKTRCETTLAAAAAPTAPPLPLGMPVKITFDFGEGWKFIRLAPQVASLRPITGQPAAFSVWVYSDGCGARARLRFRDASGQYFQPSGEALKWRGWKQIRMPMDGSNSGHWAGANDGKVHYPIQWDTLILVDGNRHPMHGELYFASPTLEYSAGSK